MMREYEVTAGGDAPIIIGASGLEDIAQCVRIIVRTVEHSLPMDRAFANKGSYIDVPVPFAVAARMADLTEAIERKEPRVLVSSIRFMSGSADAMDGRVYPVIRFRLREGVRV